MAHDGHFWYNSAFESVFAFQTRMELVSVSTDGVSLPKVYTWHDAMEIYLGSKGQYSDLVSINNVSVVDALQQVANMGAFQDPDSLYNNVFWSLAYSVSHNGNAYHGGTYESHCVSPYRTCHTVS
jgi:hypothetical protein